MSLKDVKILLNAGYAANKLIGETNGDELFELIKSSAYGSDLPKERRPTISQSSTNHRPLNDTNEYLGWNGLQPIDIDIRNKTCATLVKKILEKTLYKYHWCHSIALSTSGSGLHVYTYTEPISTFTAEASMAASMLREYYLDAYEYKLMVLWKALHLAYDVMLELGVDEEVAKCCHPIDHGHVDAAGKPLDVLDVTSSRISQPLIITADPTISKNEDNFVFMDLMLPDVLTFYAGVDEKYRMNILKEQFDRIRNRYGVSLVNGKVVYADNHEFDNSFKDKIKFEEGEIKDLYNQANPMYYDNTKRYRMAYTLAYLFDVKEYNSDRYNQVEGIFLKLCSGNPKFQREKYQYSNVFKSAVDRNIRGNCPCIWSAVKELRDQHGFNIVIEVNEEEVREQIESANTTDLITEYILEPVKYNDFFKLKYTHEYHLKNNEYIGTYKDSLLSILKHGINMLDAPPGFGKTEFIKEASKEKRIMLVVPYTSILQSKIEPSDLGFECFYGDKPVNFAGANHVALTFDKFTKIDIDEVSMMFDIVAIDECHLLTMSSYRGVVPADVIDKANALKTITIIMTGTHISEHLFMNLQTAIRFTRPASTRNKNMNFVMCMSNGDKLTKIAMHIANALKSGKKILFPTNKGTEYQERLTAATRAFYGSQIKSRYYKRENHLADFVDDINLKGTTTDVDLLFCSNYLSVGVDINDTTEFDVIYDEQFTAQEIEQFNCRLRKLDIESYYYFSKVDASGMPKNITLYEDLSLDLTQDEALSFNDIQQLHLQTDVNANLWDFFKYAFTMPYFIKDHVSGEVHVHNTCFRLHKFEEKWREWAIQLNVVATFLSYYGYTCDVVQNISENEDAIQTAVAAAKEAAGEYRKKRNDLTAQFLKLAKSNDKTFAFIMDVKFEDIVDSDTFDIVKRKGKPTLLIADSSIFTNWRRIMRLLSRYYVRETIFDIIEHYCYDGEVYNISASNRLIDALRVIQNTEDENLVESNIFIVDKIINKTFQGDVNYEVYMEKSEVDFVCMEIAGMYLKHQAEFAQSLQFRMKIEQLASRIFKALVVKSEKHTYKLVELPPFDAPHALQRNKTLSTVMALFGESASLLEAEISKNALGKSLADSVKGIMGSLEVVTGDAIEDNNVIMKSGMNIGTSGYNNVIAEIAESVREIDDSDYRFAKAIRLQNERIAAEQSKLDEAMNQVQSQSELISPDLTDALNAALDDLFGE
ncbi:hypothetical protein MA9V1_230 [Chryseobacterium phage MA9V-1]|nr:hypothetical protein MA9V1_230 [Chryseobacterium phage MA9V-1]